ncbi:MAG: hypothetical protein RR404_02120 [Bacilli bacterium]
MLSRLNRYYEVDVIPTKRIEKNEKLYKNLYETVDYSNIASVATMERTNEIDLAKIKQMLKDRDNYKKRQECQSFSKNEKRIDKPQEKYIAQDKSYDIRDVLSKAKEERPDDETAQFLRNKHYDYLLTSQVYNKKRELELDEKEEKLKSIINTLTNLDLNNLTGSELSLDLLDDLKSNTVSNNIENSSVRRLINEENARNIKIEQEKNVEMDKSFYTSNMGFNDKDFDKLVPLKKENEKSSKKDLAIKIILSILLVIITLITIYVVYINIKRI